MLLNTPLLSKWALPLFLIILYILPSANSFTPNLVKDMWNSKKMPITEVVKSQNISQTCLKKISTLQPRDVLDAYGKPPAGILAGNLHWLGHFDECESVQDYKYCLMDVNVTSFTKTPMLMLQYGFCVPQECSETDIVTGIDEFMGIILNETYSLAPTSMPSCAQYPHQPYDAQFVLAIVFFGLLLLLVILSSLYHAWYHHVSVLSDEEPNNLDLAENTPLLSSSNVNIAAGVPAKAYSQTGKTESTFNKIIFSFALPQNLPKLLSGNVSKDSINCIHGIRVLSMLWVMLGHTFLFLNSLAVNPLTGFGWLSRYGFLTITNATFSVDSFFFLSGLLVTYITLKQMKKRAGRIPWHWFYFHRYWRLTPTLIVTMIFYVIITPYFGQGPYAQASSVRPLCPTYWWTNILYINNFYPAELAHCCIGWVWYLANDMQFFVISPMLLIPLYYKPWLGLSLIGILGIASFTVTGVLTAAYDFQVFILQTVTNGSYTDIIYSKPYCRITPYLVGMVMGYVFYKYPKHSVKIHWVIALIGWIIAVGMGYADIYCIYGNYNGHIWSTAANVLYQMFSRFIWAIFLAWVVFACRYGYGGWINSLLGHSAWAPLGRLTYSTYLLHPIVMTIFIMNQGTSLYLSLTLMAFYFAGFTVMSYGCAAILSLMVEFPLVGLEKLFIPRR